MRQRETVPVPRETRHPLQEPSALIVAQTSDDPIGTLRPLALPALQALPLVPSVSADENHRHQNQSHRGEDRRTT